MSRVDMHEVEPVETAAQAGIPSVPDRADAAQRELAEIWGNQAATVETGRRGTARRDPARRRESALLSRLSHEQGELSRDLGGDDPRTIDAQLALATAYLDAGRTADAVAALEQAITAIDPADAGRLTTARAMLARAHMTARRPRLAIELYDLLLAEASPTRSGSEVLGYRVKRAVAHRANGDVRAAIGQLRELAGELEVGQYTDAAEHLLAARVELATSYVVAGRPLDAMPVYELALQLAELGHGRGHPTTLGIRVLLARAYQQANQPARAVLAYEQLAADAGRALGPHNRFTEQAALELAALPRVRAVR